MRDSDADDLWVSVDDFANEIIRWFLDCADGHTIVITRDGVPFAYMVPVEKWDAANGRITAPSARPSATATSDSSGENSNR